MVQAPAATWQTQPSEHPATSAVSCSTGTPWARKYAPPLHALLHLPWGMTPLAAQLQPILTAGLSQSCRFVIKALHMRFPANKCPCSEMQHCNSMHSSVCMFYILSAHMLAHPVAFHGHIMGTLRADLMSICLATCSLQGEAVAVEEKHTLSLLDKIRGKRHSSADHPAAIPSTPSGKRHSSFELGQIPICMSSVASPAGMLLSTSWASQKVD